ncbi:hypothetical protein WA1_48185 [Scytonema hofmannii PCC 7110]|uniref:Uncharacterized protein n=2 Tax=Scytonema hofmannii TaxID=34078 RepID=A0A139WY71_9CYAN|nr:hypothetical protein WA1_48185 [Scytonema hofmannii PCC 7110]
MSMNNRRSFELRRLLDDVVYRYSSCEPFQGQLAWKREDLDIWVTLVNGRGWVCVDAELEIVGIPWEVTVEQQESSVPPAGIWVSRKGDKSYVYELVYT